VVSQAFLSLSLPLILPPLSAPMPLRLLVVVVVVVVVVSVKLLLHGMAAILLLVVVVAPAGRVPKRESVKATTVVATPKTVVAAVAHRG